MQVRNPNDLGLLLRQRRREHGWSQREFAARIGVSRHWVMDVEKGKPTAEIGLVFKAFSALGLVCDIRKGGLVGFAKRSGGESHDVPVPDLARVLKQSTGNGDIFGGAASTAKRARRERQ